MTYQTPSRAKQSTTSTGTGTLTLITGDTSLQTFQSAYGGGPVKIGYVLSGDGYYEIGDGTFTAPNTLTRDNVVRSSNGNAPVNLPTGSTDVFGRWPGASTAPDTFSGSKTQSTAEWGNTEVFKGTTAQTYSLLAQAAIPFGFEQTVINEGTAILTIAPNGTEKINGVNASVTLAPGEWCILSLAGDTSNIGWAFLRGAWADTARTSQANTFTQDQTISSTTAGAGAGPNMILDRAIAGATSNQLGVVDFRGRDTGSTVVDYAKLVARIIDATIGSPDGGLDVQTIVNNVLATRFSFAQGLFSANATGGDKGLDTVNVIAFYKNGTALPDQTAFTSSDIALSAASGGTIAHGLGVIPTSVEMFLVNQTAEHNYAVGMVVPIKFNADSDGSGTPSGIALALDATNISYRITANTPLVNLLDLTSGASFAITAANWKVRFRVRA